MQLAYEGACSAEDLRKEDKHRGERFGVFLLCHGRAPDEGVASAFMASRHHGKDSRASGSSPLARFSKFATHQNTHGTRYVHP